MPTCVESAGDERLWKGGKEKKQVQQSGAMRASLLDRKNSWYPGYFCSSILRAEGEKKESVSTFLSQVLYYGGMRSVGGSSYVTRDSKSRLLLFPSWIGGGGFVHAFNFGPGRVRGQRGW